jgi:hypothetical protein
MSNKHHAICKSKTLDVPIIITNDYDVSSSNSEITNTQSQNNTSSTTAAANQMPLSGVFTINSQQSPPAFTNKFQKGYSLDSQHLSSQNSLSSSSNSISSSNNSIQNVNSGNQFHHQHRQYLQPPSSLNSSQAQNINADFLEANNLSSLYERYPLANRKLSENLDTRNVNGSCNTSSAHLI